MHEVIVIGGGLAGSEAAWQAANRGIKVIMYEMRPYLNTGAHTTSWLAELVCSNSLGSKMEDRASGLLKNELRMLNSLLVQVAEEVSVPAGNSLSVDRNRFAKTVTQRIENHPNIKLIREEVKHIPDQYAIIASGPLTSPALTDEIQKITGEMNLFFYDALSPIVYAESINMNIAYKASRYERGDKNEGDYINCPLSRTQYEDFVENLSHAERIQLKTFETDIDNGVKAGSGVYFEGCLPVEVIASRGQNALAFGPMRPVGLINPRDGKRPYAVVQLRQDNLAGTLYNLVGFQTNLTFIEQKRVLRMIPGLEKAEFARFGQMHRNTFIASPLLLRTSMQLSHMDKLFFAGQITGIEGYMGNIASGLIAGINAARRLQGLKPLIFPCTTMLGALSHYITETSISDFQPMKANFGILPSFSPQIKNKRQRYHAYADRALHDLREFIQANNII